MADDDGQTKAGNPLGPTGERVMRNIARIRTEQRMTYRELSERLHEIGRPIPELGLSRIEKGKRRVDADDLAALAIVFGVTPNTLLLPVGAGDQQTNLTETITVEEWQAWSWADGFWPLLTEAQLDLPFEGEVEGMVEEFKRRVRPVRVRRYREHQALRAVESVANYIGQVLATENVRGTPVPDGQIHARRAMAAEAPEGLIGSLIGLIQEVDKLLGETTPEHPTVRESLADLMKHHALTFSLEEVVQE